MCKRAVAKLSMTSKLIWDVLIIFQLRRTQLGCRPSVSKPLAKSKTKSAAMDAAAIWQIKAKCGEDLTQEFDLNGCIELIGDAKGDIVSIALAFVARELAYTQRVPQTSFVTLAVELGAELVHQSAPIRSRATQILAFLAQQDDLLLSASAAQVWTILEFFSSRLSDFSSLQASFLGLSALLEKAYPVLKAHQVAEHKPCGPSVVLFRSFFEHVHAQALEQKLRMQAYALLAAITSGACAADLQEGQHAIEFCGGFISAMDGEKDPQCLLVALRIAGRLVGEHAAAVQPLLEELFDVTACYFPVTYTPPAGDTTGITRQQIAGALGAVLGGSHHMAELLVPLLLEKLSSTRQLAKQDAIALLVTACNNYGIVPFPGTAGGATKRPRGHSQDQEGATEPPLGLYSQLPSLRDAFIAELTHSQDESVHAGVMQGVSAVAAAVSRYVDSRGPMAGDAWAAFVLPIFKFCLGELEKAPDSMQARVCRKGLAALSASGARCLRLVFGETMPLLLNSIQLAASPLTVTACISTLELLLLAVDRKVDFAGEAHPLQPHTAELFRVLQSTILDDGVVQGKIRDLSASGAGQSASIVEQSAVPRGGAVAERRGAAARAMGHLLSRPPSLLVQEASLQEFVGGACDICMEDADEAVQQALLEQLVHLSGGRAQLADAVLGQLQRAAVPCVRGALKQEVEALQPQQLGRALVLIVRASAASPAIAAQLAQLVAVALSVPAGSQVGLAVTAEPMCAPPMGEIGAGSTSSASTASATALSCAVLQAAVHATGSFADAARVDDFLTAVSEDTCVIDRLLCTSSRMLCAQQIGTDQEVCCRGVEQLLLVAARGSSAALHADITRVALCIANGGNAIEQPGWLTGWFASRSGSTNLWQHSPAAVACITAPLQVLPAAVLLAPSVETISAQCQFLQGAVDAVLAGDSLPIQSAQAAAFAVGSVVNFSFHHKDAGKPLIQAATAACSVLADYIQEHEALHAGCLAMFSSLVAALAAAGSPAAAGFIQQTAQWVLQAAEPTAAAAAVSLKHMLDSSSMFSKSVGAVQRPLFRHRHFKAVMGTLMPKEAAKPADCMSHAHLLAICSALPCLSVSSLIADFVQYKPVLLSALGSAAGVSLAPLLPYKPPQATTVLHSPHDTTQSLRVAAVSVLYSAVSQQPALLQDCVMEVVPRLLHLCRMQSSPSPLVRVLAIDTVASLAQLPHSSTFPVYESVLRCLAECVDDAKRAVRRKAAVARGVWSVLAV